MQETGMKARRTMLAGLAAVLVLTTAGRAQDAVKPVAVINGEAISATELDMALKLSMGGQPPPTPLTQQQKRQQQLQVLAALIEDKLMEQFLRKNGAPIDATTVDRQLAEMTENLKKQNKTFADFLKETGQTEADVRRNVTLMLQWEAWIKSRYSDTDVKKYYDDYKDCFDQVRVRASHILVQVPPEAPDAQKQEARQKLTELRQQIVAGKLDFAEAAKQHSQCPTGTQSGGDVGYFTRKWMMDENFSRVAFSMKVGEVSELVQTDFGLHIIKVTDRQPGQPSEFDKIKDEVKEFYIEDMRLILLNQQRKASQIEINLP
jgi:parvulin-like peptidyl-prolyl isomerase